MSAILPKAFLSPYLNPPLSGRSNRLTTPPPPKFLVDKAGRYLLDKNENYLISKR